MTDDNNDDFDYGEEREDGQYENYPTIDEGEFEQEPRDTYVHADGCGGTTTMMGDLPESIARDPEYYSKTFCHDCGEHVPVEEVEWDDGSDWVVDSGPEAAEVKPEPVGTLFFSSGLYGEDMVDLKEALRDGGFDLEIDPLADKAELVKKGGDGG